MDIISGLFDELLIKILLLVPTKVAVSTSILSKRWEYLWMWLPKLEYSNRDSSSAQWKRLRYFLDKNLPLHRAPVIESFRLDLTCAKFKTENVKFWVVLAVSRCVRELEIMYSSNPSKPKILLSNLYTCKSLLTLKLDGEILLDVPRMVFLPSLKTLQLRSVSYLNEESLQRLLSNCPVLEDLLVDLPENGTMGKLTVVFPSLQSLSLFIPYDYSIDGIVIQTPSLKYFKLKDHKCESHYCLIENMPNLIEAYVDVEFPNINSLIGSITSVKRLEICSVHVYDEGFVFNQLEHLEVCRSCNKKCSPNLLVRLLKDSPNLQVLDLFVMKYHQHIDYMEYWNQPSTVSECMSSLQTFNWIEYSGEPEERDVAVYILENALHLKTATIEHFERYVPKLEVIKELARSSRASSKCKLMFH
ncbi:FBD-associated F-box protein [Cardamine amara subsp. amara]|uniref:FBD-associated F-box protein n=1 Tax=Cardamine amara subsp. amara TaxID=228776 RepID=A0ABD1B555_CARAN